ncbi:hypothetical protein DYU05_08435 [Mucilaginibacter terrenus]|uniref:HEAT repeat domain-containing protein n=1 Tax=Mucilaginibacter terrenus TaxID=2482727 RepID=A0A3E2NXD9_9SPHI|nr:hypothetical protein [Mucilaginibacter terrenus]RFZ85609.1 hypothetical protein DYU05_08435 [Mucilaginibacter terrenus]
MTDINQKLEIAYDLMVDNHDAFKEELKTLIATPSSINDTNRFASLLVSLKGQDFIEPLLQTISLSKKGDVWLSDFLFAVVELVDESPEDLEFITPENLVEKLGDWISGSPGELAWKAAGLLKFHQSDAAEKIQLKKLEEHDDFFLTYVECLLGLIWYNKEKHMDLVKKIANDESRDPELRQFAADIERKYC